MALNEGTHQLGPSNGSLDVHTAREGAAKAMGHELKIAVKDWSAAVEVDGDVVSSISLDVNSGSLEVTDGTGGAKPLSDKDRKDILANINGKILQGQPISFRSSSVSSSGGKLTATGDLAMNGARKSATFALDVSDDGHITGKLALIQSDYGIKPFKAMMGALKVADKVEVAIDVRLPA